MRRKRYIRTSYPCLQRKPTGPRDTATHKRNRHSGKSFRCITTRHGAANHVAVSSPPHYLSKPRANQIQNVHLLIYISPSDVDTSVIVQKRSTGDAKTISAYRFTYVPGGAGLERDDFETLLHHPCIEQLKCRQQSHSIRRLPDATVHPQTDIPYHRNSLKSNYICSCTLQTQSTVHFQLQGCFVYVQCSEILT